ncbi:MAG: sporulation protein YqfD, partial [Acutalibacteraceae bacterium]
IKGSHAVIEVRDYIAKRDDETYGDPCNIIADFDGELLSVEVHNGTKACPEGSGVKKGDLIISGIFENRDTSCIFMEARGIVTAIHDNDLTVSRNMNQSFQAFTNKKTVKKIGFFGLSIPLGFFSADKDYEQYEKRFTLYFGQTKLPFYICEITRAYYNEDNSLEAEKKCSLFFDDFSSEEYEKYKNTQILKKKLSIKESGKTITISDEVNCIDFMGVKQKINFDTQMS